MYIRLTAHLSFLNSTSAVLSYYILTREVQQQLWGKLLLLNYPSQTPQVLTYRLAPPLDCQLNFLTVLTSLSCAVSCLITLVIALLMYSDSKNNVRSAHLQIVQ